MKSVSLILLEPYGPVQACNGIVFFVFFFFFFLLLLLLLL